MLKRVLRKARAIVCKKWNPSNEDDSLVAYPKLNSLYTRLRTEEGSRIRASYTWAMIHTAHLAASLKLKQISAIEFGVAGGNGLLAL